MLNSNYRSVIVDESCRYYKGVERLVKPDCVAKLMNDVFKMSERADEYVYIICTTRKGTPIRFFELSHGTASQSLVEPRGVLMRALLCGATDFILVHNHPSGDPEPSKEDIELTAQMKDAADLMGITMSDHIIIGRGKYFSFREAEIYVKEYAKKIRRYQKNKARVKNNI